MPNSLLLVEDNDGDATLIEAYLEGSVWNISKAATLAEAVEKLKKMFFAIILDLNLPDSRGLDTLKSIRKVTNSAIVILTGVEDNSIGLMAVQLGAQDFIKKNELSNYSLTRALLYAVERQARLNAEHEAVITVKDNLQSILHTLDTMVENNK